MLTTEPLRYAEEFVRHKILDIIGDLALLGRPLQGHLIAVKPSHAANCEMARLIGAQMQKPIRAAQDFWGRLQCQRHSDSKWLPMNARHRQRDGGR